MPLQDRPHGDDGQLSLSSTADRRGICIDNDKEEEDVRSGNDANIGSSDEEEGYDTDNTSSYDSDAYPSQLFIEIRHHGTSPYDHFELPGLDIDHSGNQKRRKLNNGLASATDQAGTEEFRSQMFVTKNVRHVSASDFWSSSLPSSSTGSDKGASLIGSIMLENPEAIQELCNATRFSYNPPSSGPPSEAGASSSSSLSPLLEKHLEAVEGAQKAQELLEQAAAKVDARQRLPRPSVAAAVPSRDLTRIVGSAAFPAPTITFRNALEATPVPRLVTLSFAPFIVVHANGAFTSLTGYSSSDILGRPLKFVLDKEDQDNFSSSVSSLHDRMASLMCKYQGRCKCSVRVALVGPERDPHPPQEKYGEAVEDSIDNTKNRAANEDEDASCIYVTHYGVDLEPVNEGGHTERAIVSPDSSACGILG